MSERKSERDRDTHAEREGLLVTIFTAESNREAFPHLPTAVFCTVTRQRRSSGPHLRLSGPRWDLKIKSGGIPHFQTGTLLISASSGFCIDGNTCYLFQPELNDNVNLFCHI